MFSETRHETPISAQVFRIFRENGLLYLLGIIAVFCLKYHYSTADAEALGWMLYPIAHLVGLVSGIHFEWEIHSGFVSIDHGIRIAPACAGINFMIICFSALFFPLVHRLSDKTAKLSWFCFTFAIAYLATILANTARILVSIRLYSASIYGEWITPERVHRLAGSVIFLLVLILIYLVAERITASSIFSDPDRKTGKSMLIPGGGALFVPLACYLAITVIVPLLNGAYGRHERFLTEHLLQVLAASLLVLLLSVIIKLFCKVARKKRVDILP